MAQKNEAAAAGDLLEAPSSFALDLAEAARLGAEAKGAEIVELRAPQGLAGVPAAIPVGLMRGDKPDFRSLADLFERYRTRPEQKSGTAHAETLESFIALTNRHKTADSVIFAAMDWRKPALTAIIDYHERKNGGLAAFGKHRIRYAFPLSEEWQAWIAQDGKQMTQGDFAWFLEDRVPELSAPTDAERIRYENDFKTSVATPNQVVELSRGMKVHVETRVKNEQTLQTGETAIQFEESHGDGQGAKLKVPGIFIVSVAPFFFGDKIRIPARLRYRVQNGKLVWFYQLYRPDIAVTEHVRAAFLEATGKTELPGFEGSPETARA